MASRRTLGSSATVQDQIEQLLGTLGQTEGYRTIFDGSSGSFAKWQHVGGGSFGLNADGSMTSGTTRTPSAPDRVLGRIPRLPKLVVQRIIHEFGGLDEVLAPDAAKLVIGNDVREGGYRRGSFNPFLIGY